MLEGAKRAAARLRSPAWVALATLVMLPACAQRPRPAAGRGALHAVRETSDSTFTRDVVAPRRPAVVYYWAHGCIPCMGFGPHVDKVARRYSDRIAFWKLDRGWSARRVIRYGVPDLPTLVFYLGDRELERTVGAPASHADDSLAVFLDAGLRLAAAAAADSTARE